jgi:hypothetical protein
MKTLSKIFLVLAVVAFISCNDQLTEMNINPNGVDPATVNPNLMVPTIITSSLMTYLDNNYQGDVAGVMQYVQKSGWGNGLNKYDWNTEREWSSQYNVLRDAKHLNERAIQEKMEFHQGLATVIRAFQFGFIADAWGDAPYTAALNAPAGSQEDLFPVFDSQETIYKGIIDELKQANTLLSKPVGDYKEISKSADIIYGGDPAKWRKLANSLMLRYYMRLSVKLPDYAKNGIQEIMSNPAQYPIFAGIADDATMAYIGSSSSDSWPANTAQDVSQSNFDRIQLCAGFRDVLVKNNDPRIDIWFNKVKTQIRVSDKYPQDDIVVDNIRYLRPDYMTSKNMVIYNPATWVSDIKAGKTLVDTAIFVGMPIASSTGDGSNYNLNPNPIQGGPNVHNSALDDIYKATKGNLLKARLISYTEVCFILAEAADKGWSVGGSEKEWYEKGVKASFDTWGVGGNYAAYIAQPAVAHNGTLEQIMTQKWIANWTMAHEAWCDWRRTGYPVLTVGPKGVRDAMPIRYEYGPNEKGRNNANYLQAAGNLVETPYTATDGKDSSWSRFWLLQGTGKPY